MNLREKKAARKKEDILRSAALIVSRKGYHGTTMEDIAAELLMTKGSLYYYFKSKEEIIYHCHSFILSHAIDTLDQISKQEGSSITRLKNAITAHINFAINEKDTFNMIIIPEQIFTEDHLFPILEKRHIYAAIFDRIIEQGVENGEFREVNTKMTRMIILGATNWIQQWYSPEGQQNKDEIGDVYAEYLLRILQ